MQELTERQERQNIMYQFEMQLHKKTGYAIERRFSNYRYLLRDDVQQRQRRAIVLVSSWQYYEYRLHRGRWAVDLLIVKRHNAVVPCSVLELETGIESRPGKVPAIERSQRTRRNREEVKLFVSKLLIGLDGADKELEAMTPRTQRRYLALLNQYLRPRTGRPWTS